MTKCVYCHWNEDRDTYFPRGYDLMMENPSFYWGVCEAHRLEFILEGTWGTGVEKDL